MRFVIFGAGPIEDYSHITLFDDDFIICADGGYNHMKQLKAVPEIVIGDFDSANNCLFNNRITYPCEKDDTDMKLCLEYAKQSGASDCVIYGALGGRIDHSYANISLLLYAKKIGLNATIIGCNEKIMIVTDEIYIKKEGYRYISVFSLSDKSIGVSYRGMKYPLSDGELLKEIPLGISNEFIKEDAYISVKEGVLLVILTKKE